MRKGVAVVTGGTRGIGRAIVMQLVEEGYFVEFTYLKSVSLAEELELQLNSRCKGTLLNCSNGEGVGAYIEQLYNEHKEIDVLINNVGMTRDGLVMNGNWEDYSEVLAVNVGSVFHFCRAVLPKMMKRKFGNIVNISSLASHNIRYGNGFYGSSKTAVERFSQTLAIEAIRFNVAVNVVSPGFVETEFIQNQIDDIHKKKKLIRQIPLQRLTKPEEVAQAVCYLIERKPLLVGVTIPVGGGAHLNGGYV